MWQGFKFLEVLQNFDYIRLSYSSLFFFFLVHVYEN